MQRIELNKGWKLSDAPLFRDASYLNQMREKCRLEGLSCDLPADVRMPLIANGKIKDPVVGLNFLESKWVQKRSWWFFNTFTLDSADGDLIELSIESLDTKSDVFVNGELVGSQCNAFYPFVRNISGFVKAGENEIAVRVTTGLESVTESNGSEIGWSMSVAPEGKYPRGDYRMPFIRRPMYTTGMDWDPGIVTCGIPGEVSVTKYNKIVLREVGVETCAVSPDAKLRFTVNTELLTLGLTKSADLEITVSYKGTLCAQKRLEHVLLQSGYNYFTAELDIKDPRLWWPNGYGEQPLYTVEVFAECEGERVGFKPFEYGIRTITLDTSAIRGEERLMALIVNGVRVFCKGGNWVPADAIYARVTDEKYYALIREAKEANFNMLRIWGGGVFERDSFYRYCDENGILIWHDFMFACAVYPDHLDWFREEVRKEIDYQTKALRNHACIGLWCGNNELALHLRGFEDGKHDYVRTLSRQGGTYVANYTAKEVVRSNCPYIPYWCSSPYGGADEPNSTAVGDMHKWFDCMMDPDVANRIEPKRYDYNIGKFITEYGYIGPCSKKSIEEYFGGEAIDVSGDIWSQHTNYYESHTVAAGIKKHYGLDVSGISFDDYLLYAGMVQSVILSYSLESFRFNQDCSGGLFWMYNDTWGEIGWTIVDYYLRRKIAYYGVKRAFEPVKISMRSFDGKKFTVQGINDTARECVFDAEYGYLSFDGKKRNTKRIHVVLPPHSREYLLTEDLPEGDFLEGSVAFIPECEGIEPVYLRLYDTAQLRIGRSEIQILSDIADGDDRLVTLTSEGYSHGVYAEVGDLHCSDNYFDLLPGQVKQIRIEKYGKGPLKFGKIR